MRQWQRLVAVLCICVLAFYAYAIFTAYSVTGISTSERVSRILIHNAMTLTIDRGGYRNLVFDYPVVEGRVEPNYIPTISETEMMANGSSERRLSFADLVELDPKLMRFEHSEEVYNLFPLHVNLSEIFQNISRMTPISQVRLVLTHNIPEICFYVFFK